MLLILYMRKKINLILFFIVFKAFSFVDSEKIELDFFKEEINDIEKNFQINLNIFLKNDEYANPIIETLLNEKIFEWISLDKKAFFNFECLYLNYFNNLNISNDFIKKKHKDLFDKNFLNKINQKLDKINKTFFILFENDENFYKNFLNKISDFLKIYNEISDFKPKNLLFNVFSIYKIYFIDLKNYE